MKAFNRRKQSHSNFIVISARSLLVAGVLFFLTRAWAQSAPGLAIAPVATNEISVSVTNAIIADSYELWWTPVLDNVAQYPWTTAAVGNIGQTNFILSNWEYPAVFFRVILDTNAVPLWENANPSNPGTNILKVIIASPANGSVLQ